MTHLLKSYPALPVGLDRGAGVYVYDTEGRRYLDMYSGHAVTSTGHCHPHVVRAVQEQAAKLLFYSNVIGIPIREEAAAKLLAHAPEGITKVFFVNSGAEANENALKLARNHTGRKKVIAMEEGFHGRTAGAVSVTGIEKYRKQAEPLVPGVVFAKFGEAPPIDDETAAVLLEPIQALAGVKTAPPEYFEHLREACDKHGTVLIYDEAQTGIGRTGSMYFGGKPDLITLAKGIASGIPASAVLVKDEIAEKVQYGEYGATFGAGPVAMAAVKATIEVIENEDLLRNVRETGARLAEKVAAVPGVKEVRGKGFLLGIKTAADGMKVLQRLFEKGVLVGLCSEPGLVRLSPPLTLQPEHVDEFLPLFEEALSREL